MMEDLILRQMGLGLISKGLKDRYFHQIISSIDQYRHCHPHSLSQICILIHHISNNQEKYIIKIDQNQTLQLRNIIKKQINILK